MAFVVLGRWMGMLNKVLLVGEFRYAWLCAVHKMDWKQKETAMFTLFVLALIVIGVVAAVLIGMIKQNRAEIMELKRHIQRLEARFDGIAERE